MSSADLPVRLCPLCSRPYEYDLRVVALDEKQERSLVALARCPGCARRDPNEVEAQLLLASLYSTMAAGAGALVGGVGILFGLPTWLAVGGGIAFAVLATMGTVLWRSLARADRLVRLGALVEDAQPARICPAASDFPPAQRRAAALAVIEACAVVAGLTGDLGAAAVATLTATIAGAALHRAPVPARIGYALSAFLGCVASVLAFAWYFEGRESALRYELMIPVALAAIPMLLVYAAVAVLFDWRSRSFA